MYPDVAEHTLTYLDHISYRVFQPLTLGIPLHCRQDILWTPLYANATKVDEYTCST